MTRTTSSHHTAPYELSPVAALRALRCIAYQDFDAYRPAAETPSWAFMTTTSEFSDDMVLDDSWVDEIDLRDDEVDTFAEVPVFAYQPAPAADVPEASRVWYLNEVPSEWIQNSFAPDHGSTPISA